VDQIRDMAIGLFLTMLLAWGHALGADVQGRFAIKGAGFATCQNFIDARSQGSKRYYQFGGWINGYLTALNEKSDATFDLVSWEAPDILSTFVANYCERFPGRRFYLAVRELAEVLERDRLEQFSPVIAVKVGDKGLGLYELTLRRAQGRLRETGHYDGEVDGRFGPATREALRAFQRERGLRADGFPDQRTLHALFRGQ
jgi:hypothetical protein